MDEDWAGSAEIMNNLEKNYYLNIFNPVVILIKTGHKTLVYSIIIYHVYRTLILSSACSLAAKKQTFGADNILHHFPFSSSS